MVGVEGSIEMSSPSAKTNKLTSSLSAPSTKVYFNTTKYVSPKVKSPEKSEMVFELNVNPNLKSVALVPGVTKVLARNELESLV